VVEDARELREGLVALLGGSPGFSCVGAHANGAAALKRIPSEKPDVVVMDIDLPDTSGIECVRRLKADLPNTRVLMLTNSQNSKEIFAALQSGAHGYLVKDVPYGELLHHIQQIHQGYAPMSPAVAQLVIGFLHKQGQSSKQLDSLTPSQERVLELLAKGGTNKEIAQELSCAEGTVATHLNKIYEKLHVHSRAGAVAKYLRK
jgi:DNA-binding NarL/FixJ family response regulator